MIQKTQKQQWGENILAQAYKLSEKDKDTAANVTAHALGNFRGRQSDKCFPELHIFFQLLLHHDLDLMLTLTSNCPPIK